jgi:error-prone DNA polymerase
MPEYPAPKLHDHPWRDGPPGPSGAPGSSGPIGPSGPLGPPHAAHPCDIGTDAPASPPAILHLVRRTHPHRYVELSVASNFSFLEGASHPEEYVERAAAMGSGAVAITDRHTLAGVVRAHVAAKKHGVRLVVGSRVRLRLYRHTSSACEPCDDREPPASVDATRAGPADTPSAPPASASSEADTCEVLLHPTDLASYGQLCRLLTVGKRRTVKGECDLSLHDLLDANAACAPLSIARGGSRHPRELLAHGLLCTLLPPPVLDGAFLEVAEGLRSAFGDRFSVAVLRTGDPGDAMRSQQLRAFSEWTGIPLVAVNDVHAHLPERRPLQDILACIRHGCTIQQAGYRLFRNAERHLKTPNEMVHLFADMPEAVSRTSELADRAAGFSMDQLRYRYPSEVAPPGRTVTEHLRDLTMAGASERYPTSRFPGGLPQRVSKQIEHELALIAELRYEPFFLTVQDLVRFARSRNILCQGRGAAANSAVCYCLGITAVDPNRIDVLFERFVSKERNEPPDIDVDFEHERREEVIQYLYRTYGRDRAALAAEVISYRGRSAIRDVGKALGLSIDCVERLASEVDWWEEGSVHIDRVRQIGLDPRDPTIRRLAYLSSEILGFPRHLSQHVGGFVITDGPLCELVPIENAAMDDRTVIEWDKDDIDAMGMLKVDVLALGMLTCIRKAIDLVNADREPQAAPRDIAVAPASATPLLTPASSPSPQDGTASSRRPHPLEFHTIPAEDPRVYDMICAADTIGVFQIESRAQMSMLPRLRPRSFYDLVVEVAIVRPGPIQGDMVHPYLRRRNGEEPTEYPDDAVRQVLGKTLGVPLFQEQAMALAIVAAGFTPGEADQLRRAIGAWKRRGNRLKEFAAKLEEGMLARGYTKQFAEQVFRQIQGFSGYGFPESHAASFALLVYVSSWLKCYEPAAFAAALINSQPMGFYAPAQIVRDAREHGVEVRTIDVNASRWDCSLERPNPLVACPRAIPDDDVVEAFANGTNARGAAADADTVADTAASPPLERRGKSRGSSSQVFRSPAPLLATPVRAGSRRQRELLQDPLLRRPTAKSSAAVDQPALRLGMRLVRGLREDEAGRITDAVERYGPFHAIRDLWRASGVTVPSLRRLASADAFRSMGLNRQRALWQIRALRDEPAPLFESVFHPDQPRQPSATSESADAIPRSPLPKVSSIAAVAHDYTAVGLSLKRHPVACLRETFARRGVVPCGSLRDPTITPHKTRLAVGGVVLVRQRPSTANGILFMTIEDESGIANLIVRPEIYQRFRRIARQAVVVVASGKVERSSYADARRRTRLAAKQMVGKEEEEEELHAEAASLRQIAAEPAFAGGPSHLAGRAEDVVHVLVQRLVDASAEAIGLDLSSRDFH